MFIKTDAGNYVPLTSIQHITEKDGNCILHLNSGKYSTLKDRTMVDVIEAFSTISAPVEPLLVSIIKKLEQMDTLIETELYSIKSATDAGLLEVTSASANSTSKVDDAITSAVRGINAAAVAIKKGVDKIEVSTENFKVSEGKVRAVVETLEEAVRG